jgi:hypothetical protein
MARQVNLMIFSNYSLFMLINPIKFFSIWHLNEYIKLIFGFIGQFMHKISNFSRINDDRNW